MGIGIQTFNRTIASAGSRVQVTASSTPVYAQAIIFEAHEANTGSVYIGNASVATASYVKRLTAGNSFSITARQDARLGPDGGMLDMTKFWVDAGTAAQVICISYVLHIGP